ncbi:HNH endonuclease signature motif containing protein [Diaminobutyricimonas sp. LJ205]|uniref:HNH endonuclease signature motif containing protein n=1 Tax=Diaminobutyricimonas sp. LJ205 TaxID=2683590 RepID=UPI0012F513C1|nr:HNH endonuclease signature motif containing protein [Diaminobutyricimonas sp. LJ205]
MESVVDTFTGALAAVASTTTDLAAGLTVDTAMLAGLLQGLDDQQLLAAQRSTAESRRRLDACAALLAGEIAHRSRRDLGHTGLAQREGFRSPEALLQHTTGSTFRDAATMVQVGGMAHQSILDPTGDRGGDTPGGDSTGGTTPDGTACGPYGPDASRPWLRAVGAAVTAGTLSLEQARSIRTGLGEPRSEDTGIEITIADLTAAAEILLVEAAAGLDADRLFKRARELRDDLDEAGIRSREQAIHADRAIRRTRRPNGVHRYIIDPDLESAAFWDAVYDTLTSPRRGGPRFTSEADKAWAEGVATDPRSTEQYLHDAITELLRIGTAVDPTKPVIGPKPPAVRVLVSLGALEERTGHGWIEGTDTPVSIETVERVACTQGTIPIVFNDDGQVLNLGREQRLFSPKQRIALAARDGGCMDPDCDRPAAWTEAHHVKHWRRDEGNTDIADGILLCRYHHLLFHNNHWEIHYRDGHYWLIPPPDIDPEQTPRLMRSKSAALRDLQREQESEHPHDRGRARPPDHEQERERERDNELNRETGITDKKLDAQRERLPQLPRERERDDRRHQVDDADAPRNRGTG